MTVSCFLWYIVVITLLTPSSSTITPKCLPGWIRYGTSCYGFMEHGKEDWPGAQFVCCQYRSKLVEIESASENEFLKKQLVYLHTPLRSDFVIEGTWSWMNSQNPVSHTDWSPGQPDEDGNEDCVLLNYGSSYKWEDESCSTRCDFICEME